MAELDDHQLLAQFARENSEAAFAALVTRHAGLVYSVALRGTGNVHAAEEVTQAVFIILAKKAGRLSPKTILSGWLYQTTRLTAANFLRTEIRRQNREQEAYMQSLLNETQLDAGDAWRQIAPLLDTALDQLGARDRDALALRFFEDKSLAEVGTALGASEDAAKMRVARALEKLRKIFSRRGLTLTAAIIAGAVSAGSVRAAPPGLVKIIPVVALAKGAAAGGPALTLAKGVLNMMMWTKARLAMMVTAGALLAAATTVVAVDHVEKSGDDSWRSLIHFYSRSALQADVDETPPQVTILPTIHPHWGAMWYPFRDGRRIGINSSVTNLLMDAYGVRTTHMIFPGPMAGGKYDFIANLPQGSEKAFQQKIKDHFGVVAHKAVVPTDVWVLKLADPEKIKTVINTSGHTFRDAGGGKWKVENATTAMLADAVEGYCVFAPVIDRTGLSGKYDFTLNYYIPDRSKQIQVVTDELRQIGIELVCVQEPYEMLVVEKVKD